MLIQFTAPLDDPCKRKKSIYFKKRYQNSTCCVRSRSVLPKFDHIRVSRGLVSKDREGFTWIIIKFAALLLCDSFFFALVTVEKCMSRDSDFFRLRAKKRLFEKNYFDIILIRNLLVSSWIISRFFLSKLFIWAKFFYLLLL